MERFNEELKLLDDFTDHFLVQCPECNLMAKVINHPEKKSLIKLTCDNCGYIKEIVINSNIRLYTRTRNNYEVGIMCIGDSVDCFFHLPLWLKAPCCGHELWAYNYDHLEWLNDYIGAKLRERRQDEKYGWRNQSLASRLPPWMKLSKNKNKILKTIKKLKEK